MHYRFEIDLGSHLILFVTYNLHYIYRFGIGFNKFLNSLVIGLELVPK